MAAKFTPNQANGNQLVCHVADRPKPLESSDKKWPLHGTCMRSASMVPP
jgi:hypothetical protein